MEKEINSKEIKDTIIKASKVFIDTLEKEEGIAKSSIISFYQTEKNIEDNVVNIRLEAYASKEDLAKVFITIMEQDEDLKKIFLFRMLEQSISRTEARNNSATVTTIHNNPNIKYN